MYPTLIFGGILACVNCLIDLSYFIYMGCIIIYSKWRAGLRRLLDTDSLAGICLTSDLDIMVHMNNGRYLRECDFGRFKFLLMTRVWQTVRQLGGYMVAGGMVVRYRKAINLFDRYTVNTRILYWEDTAFYIEQSLVRKSDGFIYYLSIIKQTLVGVKADQVVEKLGYPVVRPELLPELAKWMESVQLSSDRLRKKS